MPVSMFDSYGKAIMQGQGRYGHWVCYYENEYKGRIYPQVRIMDITMTEQGEMKPRMVKLNDNQKTRGTMNPRTMHDFETIPALVNILCDIYKKFKGENVALAIDMPVVEVPMSPYSPGSTGWQNPIPEPVCISSSKVDEVIADGTTKDEDDGIQAYIKENPVGIAKKNEPEF